MKIFCIFVSLMWMFVNANQHQNSKNTSIRDPTSFDLNAIESVIKTDQKAVHDVIEKSIQQVETVVKTLEDNDIREADDVKKMLEFLVDTSASEDILIRHKRQIQPIVPLDAVSPTTDAASTDVCTNYQNSYKKANKLSATARNVMSSSASSISAATDSMNSFLQLSADADPFMREIYMKLADTMNSLITIQTKTLSDVQNALFQLTYAGATFQQELVTKNCSSMMEPTVERYTTVETTKRTDTGYTTSTKSIVIPLNPNGTSGQCPNCYLGTIQCPIIIALKGPASGTCPAGRTIINCTYSGTSACCCK